jgi:putative zinc finger protein
MSDVDSRLLRDAARSHLGAEPGPACIDADTLAAWADDTLSPRERETVESHAADCARCQALVAAMATTAPAPATAAARAWWRMPAFAWLVPAAALGLVAVVYVGTLSMGRRSQVLPGAQMVPTTVTVTAPPMAVAAPQTIQPTVIAPSLPVQRGRALGAVTAPAQSVDQAAVPREIAPRLEATDATSRRDTEERTGTRALADAPSAAPVAPPAAAAASGGSPAGAGLAPQPATPPTASFATAAQGAMPMNRAMPQVAMKAMAAQPASIVAPDGSARWRMLLDGGVERSTDGGITWQPQATGARVPLAAGAALSSTVCWLVGPGGTVLLSTDGRTWQRLAFPELVNLIAVSAADEKTATVTAVGGRTFTTTDGGKTWTR